MDYIKFDLQENSAEPLFPKVKQAYRFLTWSTNSSAILYAISQSYSATERISTVYLSDVKLNDSKPIVRNVRQLINAKMSPRGDALLYEAAEQVYVVLLDDKKTIRIGKSHHSPEWSLDGAHIVMVSKQKMNIFTVRPDGTELKQLTFIK